jgi:hypothetical protein
MQITFEVKSLKPKHLYPIVNALFAGLPTEDHPYWKGYDAGFAAGLATPRSVEHQKLAEAFDEAVPDVMEDLRRESLCN